MTGENLTPHEKEVENELKRRVENLLTPKLKEDDTLFRRFLIARNFDVDAAETMLKNHFNWRKVNKVDTILSDYEHPPFTNLYFGQTRLGFDKEGSRIAYIDSGNMDFKGLLKAYKKQDLSRYIIYTNEDDVYQMKIQSEKTGIRQDKVLFIHNLEHFSMSTATSKTVIELLTMMARQSESNYPERMKTSFVINAPTAYTIIWSILKPFMSTRSIEKLKVFGKDGWKEELLKIIDADVLPAFLGGNRTDPDGDPMCRTFVDHAHEVPSKYYVDKKATSISQNHNAKKLVISRKSKAEVKVEIIHPGSSIEWEFELKAYDIGFCLLYKESASKDSKVTELVPFQRIDTDLSPEFGVLRCEKRGVYTLVFDNTYSWMYHKEMYYIVSIVGTNNTNRNN